MIFSHLTDQISFNLDTYYKSAVDFFQDLLLIQRHGLSFPLLYPLLLQLLAGVHFSCGSYLTCAHLRAEEDQGRRKNRRSGGRREESLRGDFT